MKINLNYDNIKDSLITDIEDIKEEEKKPSFYLYLNGKSIRTLSFMQSQIIDISGYTTGRFQIIALSSDGYIKSNLIFKGEKTIKIEGEEITYYWIDGKNQKLVIAFTAMVEDYKYVYNYVDSLDELEMNRLYILDNRGKRGCYYLGEQGERNFERAVKRLILDEIQKRNIEKKDIITVGSSKGGYCALYYGFELGVGHIISAAPQFLLGDFLYYQYGKKNVEVAEFITGEKNQEVNIQILNSLLEDKIKNIGKTLESPHVYIVVGKEDDHYIPQVLPLLRCMVKYNINYTFLREASITHKTLTTFFTPHLKYLLLEKGLNKSPLYSIQAIQEEIKKIGELPLPYTISESGHTLLQMEESKELIMSLAIYYYEENEALKDLIKKSEEMYYKSLIDENRDLKEQFIRCKGYLKKYLMNNEKKEVERK